jgi:hypothetical protein
MSQQVLQLAILGPKLDELEKLLDDSKQLFQQKLFGLLGSAQPKQFFDP